MGPWAPLSAPLVAGFVSVISRAYVGNMSHAKPQRRKGKKTLWKRGSALRLCGFAREIFLRCHESLTHVDLQLTSSGEVMIPEFQHRYLHQFSRDYSRGDAGHHIRCKLEQRV